MKSDQYESAAGLLIILVVLCMIIYGVGTVVLELFFNG